MQSSIFTINRNIIIGLVSSIITAAMGYGIRLILLNYLEYDVFTNLDNWIASLSYFCSLGGIRFVINECLKGNTFLMSYCGDPMAVSNNMPGTGSLPVGTNAAGYISSMQDPNNVAIGSSSAGPSSIPGTADHSTTGIGSSSVGDASITNNRLAIEKKFNIVSEKLAYFTDQLEVAYDELNQANAQKHFYETTGRQEEWQKGYLEAVSGVKDTRINVNSEQRMYNILAKKLEDGDYTMANTSGATTTGKRTFDDSSMANDNSSTPTNTKRTSDDQ